MDRGLEYDLARQVAVALSKKDAVAAHAREELGIDPDEYTCAHSCHVWPAPCCQGDVASVHTVCTAGSILLEQMACHLQRVRKAASESAECTWSASFLSMTTRAVIIAHDLLHACSNPWQAALSSMVCFSIGGAVPLLAGAFIRDAKVHP